MNASWFGRAVRTLAAAAGVVTLAACGSGSVVSDLTPQRFITVGDGFMDVGQAGYRYTVNDSGNIWVQELAARYKQTIVPAKDGGWGYAQGGARVAAADTSPVAAPSVTAQIDALLARTKFKAGDDVVIVGGGVADIVAAVGASGISEATTQTVQAAGKALGEQVQRLVNAGATHVLVVGAYNLGNTPWAAQLGQKDALTNLSVAFNTGTQLAIVNLGKNVLFVDPALLHNLMYNKPQNYQFDNGRDPVCTTPTAATCTTSTLVADADVNKWLYADGLYFTPEASRRFASDKYAESVYYKFKNRW
ncbi:SGNH/GDSL hydrolase family protein [Ottowia testudinis]|uniref:SGNH/GDSL hydrolase family protein n=1 Tax=Ottowia testudinis TaxID=2816950 RepID=A0A975CFA3_9BURK|nr:SGNH/GDSL hydrolase family protein [Ottowia testudinis]QTD45383.1 SGNH/GDSL hydrolase family protein [Ottowia testudinis]